VHKEDGTQNRNNILYIILSVTEFLLTE